MCVDASYNASIPGQHDFLSTLTIFGRNSLGKTSIFSRCSFCCDSAATLLVLVPLASYSCYVVIRSQFLHGTKIPLVHLAYEWRLPRLGVRKGRRNDSVTDYCWAIFVQAGRDFGFLSFSMTVCFIGGTALLLVWVLVFLPFDLESGTVKPAAFNHLRFSVDTNQF